MKKLICLTILFLAISASWAAAPGQKPAEASVRAAFGAGCEKLLRSQLDTAEEEILVAIYTLTRKSLGDALVKASKRGVSVEVKYGGGQCRDIETMKKVIDHLKKNKIKCTAIHMKKKMASMHHKFAVIDKKLVATGSYNYTTSASRSNYENLVIIESAEIAELFAKEFKAIKRK